MTHDVFISYSHKDKLTAEALYATLEAKGIRCWIAPRDILPGRDWGESIIEAIEACRVMVLVFSSHANHSSQVKREIERAVNKGVTLLPFRIEDVTPIGSMEYHLSTVHWLDALTPPMEKHLLNLAEKVQALLLKCGGNTPASQPMAKSRAEGRFAIDDLAEKGQQGLKIRSAWLIFRALAKDYWPIALPLLATLTILIPFLISVLVTSDSNQQHRVGQLSVVQSPPLPNAADKQNSWPTLGIYVFNGPAEVYVNKKWVGRASNGLDIKRRPGERILLELKRSGYYKCNVFEFPKMDTSANYSLESGSEARACSVK